MNHKIIFNQNTSVNAEGNVEIDLMFIKMMQNYLNNLLVSRGYVYLNQIYEFFGVKWDPNNENPYWTTKEGLINFNVHCVNEGFEIIF